MPKQNLDDLTRQFQELFLRVPGTNVTLEFKAPPDPASDVQETLGYGSVPVVDHLVVPARVRFAPWCEQADYTAPIWFNSLCLLAWIYRLLSS